MKAKVINQNFKIEFPKLMIARDGGNIVLFHDFEYGTLVFDSKKEELFAKVGIPHKGWLMERFVDFNGSITLSND